MDADTRQLLAQLTGSTGRTLAQLDALARLGRGRVALLNTLLATALQLEEGGDAEALARGFLARYERERLLAGASRIGGSVRAESA